MVVMVLVHVALMNRKLYIHTYITIFTLVSALYTCSFRITQMSNINNTLNTNEVFVPHPIYRVSMFWYTFMGFCIFVVVSVVVSTFTNTNKPVKKDRIAPFMQRFLKMNEEGSAKYDSVDNAIELTNAH